MDFAQRMKQARLASGFSLVEAAFKIRTWLPEADWIGYDVIRRMEAGATPEHKADPVLIQALAEAYGTKVGDLSTVAADGVSMIRELVRSRWTQSTAA